MLTHILENRLLRFVLLLFFTVLLIFAACTTKDGRVNGFNPEYGNLTVSSVNFYGARIFLDHRDTGKKTPALLQNVPAGRHVVHLFLPATASVPDSAVVNIEKGKEVAVQFELRKVPSGDLQITTRPDSAHILVNHLDFGRSPLLISGLPEGDYTVQLLRSNYQPLVRQFRMSAGQLVEIDETLRLQKVVLLEHFSNTNCPPCPQADAIIEQLSRSYGAAALIPLEYHPFFPSNSDPMYLAAREANTSRFYFYQPANIPHAYVNGRGVDDPLSENSYRLAIDPALQAAAPAVISFRNYSVADSVVSGRLRVESMTDLPANTVLMIALIEDAVDYQTPPGTNGQTHFEAVLRHFFPDANGTPLTLVTGGRFTINFRFDLSAEWGRDLTVVAFLQETDSKEVLQAAWTRFPPVY